MKYLTQNKSKIVKKRNVNCMTIFWIRSKWNKQVYLESTDGEIISVTLNNSNIIIISLSYITFDFFFYSFAIIRTKESLQ